MSVRIDQNAGSGAEAAAPIGAVQFYVQSAAALLALLPMAVGMWERTKTPGS